MRAASLGSLVVLLAAATAVAGSGPRLVAEQGLDPVVPGSVADGDFRLESRVHRDGGESAKIEVAATGLDATRDASGALPEYRVVLAAPGGGETDLGALRLNRQGRGELRVRHAAADLPPFSPTLRDFEGGTLSVLRDGTSVLTGTVPRLVFASAGNSSAGRRAFGAFEGVDQPRRNPGTYELATFLDESGRRRNTILVVSPRLATDPNAAGVRPEYRVFLLAPNGGRQVDLGPMKLEKRFGTRLSLDSDVAALPGGIADVREFGGGKIEIRRSGLVLLRGFVVPFSEPDDAPLAQRTVASTGAEELSPPDPSQSARALLRARLDVFTGRRAQRCSVESVGLADGTYTVVAVDDSGTRTTLGSFAPPRALRISTSHGDELPGGRLTWLSGQDVEVLDAAGAVVLAGRFPTIR